MTTAQMSFPGPSDVRMVALMLMVPCLFLWSDRAQGEPDRGDFYEVGVRAGPGVVRPWLVPTRSGFLAGWNADGQVVLRALDEDGRPRAPETVLGLPFIAGLVPLQDGALVIGSDRLMAVDKLGRQLAPERLFERPLIGIHHGFAHGPAGLLMIALAADSGRMGAIVLWREAEGAQTTRLAARGFALLE